MEQDFSPRPDATKSAPYQSQQTHNSADSGAGAGRRVGVYDRPDRPALRSGSMMGTMLLLIAIVIALYYFFFAA
jgi:hypothetical protein